MSRGSMINDLLSAKREEDKLKRDDKQEWLESRKRAYYEFIEVFSNPFERGGHYHLFRGIIRSSRSWERHPF